MALANGAADSAGGRGEVMVPCAPAQASGKTGVGGDPGGLIPLLFLLLPTLSLADETGDARGRGVCETPASGSEANLKGRLGDLGGGLSHCGGLN